MKVCVWGGGGYIKKTKNIGNEGFYKKHRSVIIIAEDAQIY